MSLLREIQEAIIDPKSELGPILLKLRLLADRLGSDQLEEWVKYETEGYPPTEDVPEYRQVGVSFSGSFYNVAWKAENQPIPSALIEEFCGKAWTTKEMRESIAAIDSLLRKCEDGGKIGIDASNLILMLQGKIMEGMNCNSVTGTISSTAVREIQNTVRTRILELTMKLEKEVPSAAEITIGKSLKTDAEITEKVEQVVHMTVHGTNTMITNTGAQAKVTVNNVQGDVTSVVSELVNAGVPESAAKEFSEIIASEKPDKPETSFGKKAAEWLGTMLPTIAEGTWGIGISVATRVLEEVAKRYYGLD